jgi:hypothetical protein
MPFVPLSLHKQHICTSPLVVMFALFAEREMMRAEKEIRPAAEKEFQ